MTWTEYHSLEDMCVEEYDNQVALPIYLHSDRYTYLDYIEAEFDFVTTEEIGQSGEGRPMRVAKICRCNFGQNWNWGRSSFFSYLTGAGPKNMLHVFLSS